MVLVTIFVTCYMYYKCTCNHILDYKYDHIVSLTNLFAATAGTNTRNAAFKIVHSDLLK